MKSDPKQKHHQSKIKHHHQQQNDFITYASKTQNKHKSTTQRTDQQHCFHLHDQQPESINAKLKLEEFSISLNQQKGINSNPRTNNTVNLLQKSLSKKEEHQNAGWGNYQQHAKQQHKINTQNKKPSTTNTKRLYSTTRNSLTNTLHIKVKSDKKPSLPLNNYYCPQRKINLTFNNLIPDQMQLIRQQQITSKIIKKVKSLQTKKPTSASYYAASQKIFTLFNKDQKSGKKAGESMRIHSSVKDQQIKGKNQSMINDKQKMLKTFLFNNFYMNDNKNELHDQQLSNKGNLNRVDRFNQTTNNIQKFSTQRKQPNIINSKKSHHHRTYSQPIDNSSNRTKSNNKMNLSHKKYKMISDKKNKHIWGVNSQRVYNKKEQQQSIDGCHDNAGVKNEGYGYFSGRSDSQIINNSKRQPHNNTNQRDQNQSLPTSNNLSQDFSLLINLLKQQNQHVLGGQLHSYLTQAKHNIQYNYYMSSTINKKHPSRNSFNQSLKINKSNHNSRKLTNINNNTNKNHTDNNRIVNHLNEAMNNNNSLLTNDKNINKSNTARQYVPFSASKHRSKTNNFLISASQIL